MGRVWTAAGYDEAAEDWRCVGCGEEVEQLAHNDVTGGPFCDECWAEHVEAHGPRPGAA